MFELSATSHQDCSIPRMNRLGLCGQVRTGRGTCETHMVFHFYMVCCSLGSQVCKPEAGRSRQECNNRESTSLDMWEVKGLVRCMVADPDHVTAGAAP